MQAGRWMGEPPAPARLGETRDLGPRAPSPPSSPCWLFSCGSAPPFFPGNRRPPTSASVHRVLAPSPGKCGEPASGPRNRAHEWAGLYVFSSRPTRFTRKLRSLATRRLGAARMDPLPLTPGPPGAFPAPTEPSSLSTRTPTATPRSWNSAMKQKRTGMGTREGPPAGDTQDAPSAAGDVAVS